jgi:glycosyltransferase involved in cell wall biosynthesis
MRAHDNRRSDGFSFQDLTMRIAQLVNDLGFGGMQRIVADLSIQLKKRGHSVTVICLREIENGVPARELQKAGLKVLGFNKPEGFHLPTLRKLIAYLRVERVQVLNSHNHLVHHYAVSGARRAGVPVVMNTLHGTATLAMPWWGKMLFWASCAMSDGVISVSSEVRNVFACTFRIPRQKLEVIDNGIDLSAFLELPGPRKNGALVFGTVGRLVPVKDYPNLLRAFTVLHRNYPSTRLRILGGGPCEGELRRAAQELQISEHVDFCGFSHDVPGFLSGIDIYVSSSLSEGLPVSILEALGAGLPVVTTAVGGVVGVADRTESSWLCAPADPGALASAMEAAVKAPDRAVRASRAREIVREYYSVERMTDDYERLYGKLLARAN